MKIINFGSLNIDYVYSVDHFVKPGETISSDNMEIYPGGKGLNQSIAIARAGGSVIHSGVFSDDGVFLYNMLKNNNVDVSTLKKVKSSNGHAIIQVAKNGENSIILFTGTNGMIDESYIDKVIEKTVGNEIVLFQNETSSIGYAMKRAKDRGCMIAFNPAPMNSKVHTYPLELVDILIVNRSEGMLLSGKEETSEILSSLNSKYPDAKIILTLGKNGAWYSYKNVRFYIPIYPEDSLVDTTAAGDTFIGYYLAGISNGIIDEEALYFATKAAAVCVSRKGASVSIPFKDEIV